MKKKILVVDDDKDLAFIIKAMLENYEYEVTCVYDSDSAFSALTEQCYHMILLDINLGKTSGFDICKELRRVSTIPIIFASARTQERDRITGLDIGGDDYLAKPYSLKELLSHVNALARRTYDFTGSQETVTLGDIAIDIPNRQVLKKGESIALSLKEFDVLAYLARKKGMVVTKEELLAHIWGTFSEVEPATVTVHIRWIREKLEDDPANPIYIKTIWGKGYRIEETHEK